MSWTRDLVGALSWVFRSAAEVALRAGVSERDFCRLAGLCYRWERDGEISAPEGEETGAQNFGRAAAGRSRS